MKVQIKKLKEKKRSPEQEKARQAKIAVQKMPTAAQNSALKKYIASKDSNFKDDGAASTN